jgi:hypothetical protein
MSFDERAFAHQEEFFSTVESFYFTNFPEYIYLAACSNPLKRVKMLDALNFTCS